MSSLNGPNTDTVMLARIGVSSIAVKNETSRFPISSSFQEGYDITQVEYR